MHDASGISEDGCTSPNIRVLPTASMSIKDVARERQSSTAQRWMQKISAFFAADHLTGRARCWHLNVVALYVLVISAYRIYVNTNARIQDSADYNEEWSTTTRVAIYIVVCGPVAVIYQFVMSGNRVESTALDCSIAALACAAGSVLMAFDHTQTSTSYEGIFTMVGVAGWAIMMMANAAFGLGLTERMPAWLGRHFEELRRARELYCKQRLTSHTAPSDTKITLLPDPKLGLDPIVFDAPRGSRIEDVVTAVRHREEPSVTPEHTPTLKQRIFTFFRAEAPPSYEAYLKNSRPPIVIVSACCALLVMAVLAATILSTRFAFFSDIADDLRDIANQLDEFQNQQERRLEESSREFDNAIRRLDRAAHRLGELQRDITNSMYTGACVALAVMLPVVAAIVPRFDRAVVRMAAGKLRENLSPGDKANATAGAATAFFGSTISVVAVGYVLNTIILGIVALIFINSDIRKAIWSYRYYFYSYAISFIIKSYIIQPYVFHKFASEGGHELKRHTAFMLCNIAWTAYNFIIGATVAILRACYYILYVTIAVTFLDECILPDAMRSMDTAHMSFLGTVWSHHRHHNPIVHVAAGILAQLQKDAASADIPSYSLAAKRWHLAYTLLNNPSLVNARYPEPAPTESKRERNKGSAWTSNFQFRSPPSSDMATTDEQSQDLTPPAVDRA